jgi:gamma-D-glutamyl-L-lysine dipeptidyl-peptidase
VPLYGPALAAAVIALNGTAVPTPTAYVDVAVATVWTSPQAPRAIDRPALGDPVDVRAWSRSLDTAARRGLVGRIQTQALYGEPVQVLGHRGAWAHVAVVDQPTPRDPRGYPGWVPNVQLSTGAWFGRLLQQRMAVVVRPAALLRGTLARLEVSYGTRLPVIGTAGSDVVVATPDGRAARLARGAVSTFSPRDATNASGRDIVRAARMFQGVRYLWGGTSAFGFDCSGLIELAFRTAGLVIPRDADAQARGGHAVSRQAIRPGDLLFYGRSHVHHVTLYVGGGRMIEAPNSASTVRVSLFRLADYAGARRYLRP